MNGKDWHDRRIVVGVDGSPSSVTALCRAPRALARPARPWDLSEPHERDWFGVLGDGLVVVWPAQADREWPRAGGAWVHIAPSGTVTAFTGKVDVGLDNQTAFRLLVAEEMAVDPDDVRVVQGDTDLCPYDAGTSGNRSIHGAGEALRMAARGARQILLGLATARLGGPRAHLTTDRGAVVCGPTGLPHGTWVAGTRRAEVLTAEPRLTPAEGWSAASRRHAAARLDVVTGARCFLSDMQLPGILHGAVLRAPVPGAVLRTVDCGTAEARPGVTVVRDGEFIGVTAGDPVTARRALAAIKADWDEPAPGSADRAKYPRSHPVPGHGCQRAVSSESRDVEAGAVAAATRVRATYTTGCLAHVPPEARAAVAEWNNGRLTVWTGTNAPFAVRAQLSNTFRISEAAIRVIVPPVGGGFGGSHGEEAIEAARLARVTFRPVKVHWSDSAAAASGRCSGEA